MQINRLHLMTQLQFMSSSFYRVHNIVKLKYSLKSDYMLQSGNVVSISTNKRDCTFRNLTHLKKKLLINNILRNQINRLSLYLKES